MADEFGGETHASNMINQEILDNPDENPGIDFGKSLFGEEITEAELMGEDPPKDENDPKGDNKDPDDTTVDNDTGSADPKGEKDGDDPDGEGTGDDDGADGDPDGDGEGDDPKTPPEGFVSIKALHRERESRKKLQNEVAELRDALEDVQVEDREFSPKSSLKSDFKILNKEEYETLSDEDPVAAMQYRLDYQEYKANEKAVADRQVAIRTSIQEGYEKVLDALPEIADEDNGIADQIEDFADSFGIDSKVFLEMANPATMVVDDNGQAKPLGSAAADFLLLLHGVMTKTSTIEKDTDAKLRKEIEAEVIRKFKKERSDNFKSIEDAPGTGETPDGVDAPMSEAAFMKLSPKERQELLMGAPGI